MILNSMIASVLYFVIVTIVYSYSGTSSLVTLGLTLAFVLFVLPMLLGLAVRWWTRSPPSRLGIGLRAYTGWVLGSVSAGVITTGGSAVGLRMLAILALSPVFFIPAFCFAGATLVPIRKLLRCEREPRWGFEDLPGHVRWIAIVVLGVGISWTIVRATWSMSWMRGVAGERAAVWQTDDTLTLGTWVDARYEGKSRVLTVCYVADSFSAPVYFSMRARDLGFVEGWEVEAASVVMSKSEPAGPRLEGGSKTEQVRTVDDLLRLVELNSADSGR